MSCVKVAFLLYNEQMASFMAEEQLMRMDRSIEMAPR